MSQPSKRTQHALDAVEDFDQNMNIVKRGFEAKVARTMEVETQEA